MSIFSFQFKYSYLRRVQCLSVLQLQLTIVCKDQRIPSSRNNVVIRLSILHSKVNEVGRSTSIDSSFGTKYLTSNNFSSEVIIFVDWYVSILEFLVLRITELEFGLQINPQLEAKGSLCEAGRHFSMKNTFPSSHPLDISRSDYTLMTSKVLVSYFT